MEKHIAIAVWKFATPDTVGNYLSIQKSTVGENAVQEVGLVFKDVLGPQFIHLANPQVAVRTFPTPLPFLASISLTCPWTPSQ